MTTRSTKLLDSAQLPTVVDNKRSNGTARRSRSSLEPASNPTSAHEVPPKSTTGVTSRTSKTSQSPAPPTIGMSSVGSDLVSSASERATKLFVDDSAKPTGAVNDVLPAQASRVDGVSQVAIERETARLPHESQATSASDRSDTQVATFPPKREPLPIRQANPAQSDSWVLHCRVFARAPIRSWENWTSNGRLFSVHLIDAAGDMMKATVFNAGVDSFDSILSTGVVCTLSGGKFKYASSVFSTDKCEVTFDSTATIVRDDDPALLTVAYSGLVSEVNTIPTLPIKSKVSIFAIIHGIAAMKRLKTAKAKDCVKRDILVVDLTSKKVVCTLWGYHAKDDISQHEGHPVFIKDAEVAEYNGVYSLNVGIGAVVLLDPSGPESDRLRTWYGNLTGDDTFTSL